MYPITAVTRRFPNGSPSSQPRNFSPMAEYSAVPRVLIVDDEPLIRWSLSETLGDRGCAVAEAGDRAEAVAVVSTAHPAFDVVLLDFRLPDSDDLGLLATIRRLIPDAQVILMSAYGTPEVQQQALDLGAYSVLGKPFELNAAAALVFEAGARKPA